MMRQKLLHRMKGMCGATSHMMKDELIVGKHQVDGTRLLIYIYIYQEPTDIPSRKNLMRWVCARRGSLL